jgi:two-component system sensor histidine kinase KdpD
MNNTRPNPDALLARVNAEEASQSYGRLKIFFGAAAGVGKTYSMLQAAHERKAEGIDVVIGYVEPHGRKETEALINGLEQIPYRMAEYRGALLREFDLDAALARKPQLMLVDELAHTNSADSRHIKRWQDVEELLAAGINVYTTVNVQHIESLNDVVAQITSVIVRETVPDKVVEQADEIELIDLTPDELLQRLKEGKIYGATQAERAIQGFFRKGNLIALRELALRRTADRVDEQMQRYRRDHAISTTWPATMRLLVGVSASPSALRLVRAARRMAAGLRAEWVVAYVETPNELRRTEAQRDQIIQTLRLAEQLGAETVTLSGEHAADVLIAYARERNVSKIVVGKPDRPRWKDVLFGSTVDSLLRSSGVIDIYVLSGDFGDTEPLPTTTPETSSSQKSYLWACGAVAVCTALAWIMDPYFDLANIIMVYLLGVVAVATRGGRGPSILVVILSVAAFDFFFVPPSFTLAVSDTQYLITFGVMLLVGMVISTLTVRRQEQVKAARIRERRTAALYALSREFASLRGLEQLIPAAVRNIHEVFDSKVMILLPLGNGRLQPWGTISGWMNTIAPESVYSPSSEDQGVSQWVYDHKEMAGLGTNTLPGADAIYLPLVASERAVGVLGVRPGRRQRLAPEQVHLLETFANQTALAIARAQLAEDAQHAQVQVETERLRNSLLSSVSHDLRTPLTIITGATSSLLEDGQELDRETRTELAQTAYDESVRLNRLVANLLDMTRIEAGAIQVKKEWQPIEEVIGVAIARVETSNGLAQHPLSTNLPDDLPLVPIDAILIEQVLVNLIENAVRHTPAATPISISCSSTGSAVIVAVADRGPGFPAGSEDQIFDKFYRAQQNGSIRGVGLGLTICRGIITAHAGRIWAEQNPAGGAIFRFLLPIDGDGSPPTFNMNE